MARPLTDREYETWLTETTALVFAVRVRDLVRDPERPERFAFLFKSEPEVYTERAVPSVRWESLEELNRDGVPRVNAMLPHWSATRIRRGLMSFEPNSDYRPAAFAHAR